MSPEERSIRQQLIDGYKQLNQSALNEGTSGNLSLRYDNRMLITPSAIPCDELEVDMIVNMPVVARDHKDYGHFNGIKPSTEWRFHLDILHARPEISAVVHTHATYSTVLSILRKDIQPAHYMIAAFGGRDIRCASYALFGTEALSDNVLDALESRLGCLMANHGMITISSSLKQAIGLAFELENLAKQYYLALCAGTPVLLSDNEINDALKAFSNYKP